VALSLLQLAFMDWTAKRLEEARARYEDVVRRYAEFSFPEVRDCVANALYNLGSLHASQGRRAEARARFEELLSREEDPSTPSMKGWVAYALNGLGGLLAEEDRFEEAQARFERVVRSFAEESEGELRQRVGEALNGAGFSLVREAKRCRQRQGPDAASAMLERAREKITEALRYLPEEPSCLGNAAYIAYLQGRHEEARAGMAEALRRGGEPLRRGSLEDTDLHPLPEDEAWRRFLRELPL
jgi:tetratricopeptide (TPR) repeat protein